MGSRTIAGKLREEPDVGKPLVRFCEGQEINCDMDKIKWHRRESRRTTEKTNVILQSRETPVYSKNQDLTGVSPDVCADGRGRPFCLFENRRV